MNKQLRFIFVLVLVILPGFRSAFAQTAFASEDELKQQALKLFEDDEFEEAYPLYSQLASLYPKDPNYNYRLGVCMLYASDDKEKAIPFLEFAATKPDVEKEVLFYLAKAYHLNYRFDDAIAKYLAYSKVASEAKANKLQVDHQIEMCTSGKKLLRNITDLVVIEKKELSRTDFYRAYDISDIGGKLLAKPDEEAFRTPLDKKKKEKSIIYLATNNNQVFFSSYGDDAEHGKDIYVIRKLPNGEWSKPQTLGYPVNTEYDEDYPFLHPNGKVLYFCSKGHNSMGGYDIFKTTLNEETNTWNKPVNLDFPINTPDDDILYVTNADEKEAYFSSARSSKTGKTAVFHINVERKPIDVAIIKGAVIKTKDNQALDVKITVKDLADNTILGIYNAKESGSYLINLPNGGRFMYTVEAAGFNTQSDIVILPTQYEFKPLKQEISYEQGTDKLIIKNLFDEPVDDESYLLALNFIKEKSRLEAGVDAANAAAAKNNSGADANSSDNAISKNADNSAKGNDNSTTAVDAGNNADNSKVPDNSKGKAAPVNLSNDAIVKIAYDDAKDAEKEAKDLQEQADIALNIANQKNELAQNKTKEAGQLLSDANSMTDNVKKQTAMDDANQARAESEELNEETVAAFNIAKKLQQKAAAKNEEADLSTQYAKALEAAVKSKNPALALEKLKEQEQKIEELSEKNGNAEPDNIYSGLKMDADVKKRELDKATQTSADIKQEIADNETLMGTLQSDADKTKKDDLKKGLLDQIEGLKSDNEQSKKDLEANDQKIARLTKEFNGIKNEMELVSNVVDKAKTGTNEDAAASVASIDKAKLEQQVNELKTTNPGSDNSSSLAKTNSNSSSGSSSANKNSSSESSADIAVNTNGNKITDNSSLSGNSNKAGNSGDVATNNSVNKNNASDNTGNSSTNENADYAKEFSDQITAADNLTDPIAKENKKAELYSGWVSAINDDLGKKQDALKIEKDKAKKKELNIAIATLEKELNEKQDAEKKAVASAETAKQQTGTSGNASSNSNQDNTAANITSNSVSASDNSAARETASLADVNRSYTDKITDAGKISNEAERESAKASVLKEWAAAINANVEKQKKDLAASTDPEMKALLAKKINDAIDLSKEKEDMAMASEAKATTLKQQSSGIVSNTENKSAADVAKNSNDNSANNKTNGNIVASENTANNKTGNANDRGNTNTSAAGSDNSKSTDNSAANTASENNSGNNNTAANPSLRLDKAIAFAEQSGTEREEDVKKEEAYKYYIADINDRITAKQNELKAEKDKAKKKELNTEIASLQSDVKDKQKLADETEARIKTIDSNPAIAQNNNSSSGTQNTSGGNENNISTTTDAANTANKQAATNQVTSNDNSEQASGETAPSAKAQDKIVYTNSAALEKANEAASANKEAEDLITQANDLKTQAAEKTSQSEKDALFVKASELTAQADTKKIKAAQLSSDADKSEFTANKDLLDQLAAASVKNKSDEVAMAEMMKDESNTYFDKAQVSRTQATTLTSDLDKLTALEDANANEKIALDKQRKATEIYKKANPGFVPIAKTNNTESKNNSTDQSVAGSAGNNSAKTYDADVNNNKSNENNSVTTSDASKSNDNASQNTIAANENKSPAGNNNTGGTNTVKAGDESKINTAKTDETKVSDNVAVNNEAKNNSSDAGNAGNNQTNTDNSNAKTNDAAVNESKTNEGNASGNVAGNTLNNNGDAASSGENDPSKNNKTPGNKTSVVLAPTEKFQRTNTAEYSASRPIPVNEKLPEGLVYKVQIGAFRNTISPDQFKGMTPITAETTTQGFTRYTAGYFTKFSTADQVKEEIKQLGYKDAFVVVFLNGKRISVAEALKMQGENPALALASNSTNADVSNKNNTSVANTDNSQNTVAASDKEQTPAVNSAETAKAQNVAVVGGLFYTVQVGVYSQAVSAAKLHNIQPLYSENTSNGNIRYNTGIYNNVPRATEAKNIVVEAGVKDAFVTAYYQGKRISLAEAKTLESQGSAVFSTAGNMNRLPVISANSNNNIVTTAPEASTATADKVQALKKEPKPDPSQTNKAPVVEKPSSGSELKNAINHNNTMPADSGVVFKVQIGAFKDEVPLQVADQFLKIAGKGIKNYKDANGLTIYTVGNFKTYEEASALRSEVSTVVSDAFIVAYNNGNKISVDEARTLQKK